MPTQLSSPSHAQQSVCSSYYQNQHCIPKPHIELEIDTYYRLGKKRPSSGNFVRTSLSALSLNAAAAIPKTTAPKTAVFAFQFDG
jgi:hypothetical protein